jgi:aspartyl-tRNA(Asn)/glutamyl-tRNA(Gln) amidotransferase subunit A
MQLYKLTIKDSSEKLRKGEITSVELTSACLARIKEVDGEIKACLTVCEEEAMAMAKQADARRAIEKDGASELLGIPFIAKDNIMTKGVRTTASSKMLEDYIAPYDATIIKKLKEAGAVLLAKSNLDEFAHGASTENSAFGSTRNPWDTERVPGGSSGGSAAAVAADMCVFALGTDTGGSIRCPAAFCGVTGLKPSYGRASRFGLISMTSSTDVPGPITKTAEDAALLMKIMAGADEYDATTVSDEVEDYKYLLDKPLDKLKIGLPKEYLEGAGGKILEILDEAKKTLAGLGAEIVDVSLPHTKYGIPVYYILTPSEISSNLARFDGIRYGYSANGGKPGLKGESNNDKLLELYKMSRGGGFGPEVKRRVMLGTYALSAGYFDAYYLQAQKVRTIIKNEMDLVLSEVDCLLTPTSPDIAFKIGEKSNDPLKMYLEDIFVTGPSLAGLPAISIPAGFSQNMPVGIQLIGRRLGEGEVLRVAHQFQKVTEFHLKKPELSAM